MEDKSGFVPHTCWIAEVKELCHMPHLREAPNRLGKEREKEKKQLKKVEKLKIMPSSIDIFGFFSWDIKL
jgi:hypothetical protein